MKPEIDVSKKSSNSFVTGSRLKFSRSTELIITLIDKLHSTVCVSYSFEIFSNLQRKGPHFFLIVLKLK